MVKIITSFIENCITCQQIKPINQKKAGLMMPLPILEKGENDISMNFITHLPKVQGKTVIMVVVDKMSKYAHFGALPSSFNIAQIVDLFIEMIVKLHGIPSSIVSDRDSIFTYKFWIELHKKCGTTLHFTSAYHPQSDGQIEVTNRGLEMYLRSFCDEDSQKWLHLLPWCELLYNNSFHSSLGMTPF